MDWCVNFLVWLAKMWFFFYYTITNTIVLNVGWSGRIQLLFGAFVHWTCAWIVLCPVHRCTKQKHHPIWKMKSELVQLKNQILGEKVTNLVKSMDVNFLYLVIMPKIISPLVQRWYGRQKWILQIDDLKSKTQVSKSSEDQVNKMILRE